MTPESDVMNTQAEKDAAAQTRRSLRADVNAGVVLRRSGQLNYPVRLYDLSIYGCKVEFVERPRLGECVWVKVEGLESLEALVRWVRGAAAGLEFRHPIHSSVYEALLERLAAQPK